MKIIDAKRDDLNAIIFVLEGDVEVSPTAEYIAKHKPQIGDEYEFTPEVVEESNPE